MDRDLGSGRATSARPVSADAGSVGRLTIPALGLAGCLAILSQGALGPFLPLIDDALETSVSLVGQVPAASMLLASILGRLSRTRPRPMSVLESKPQPQ